MGAATPAAAMGPRPRPSSRSSSPRSSTAAGCGARDGHRRLDHPVARRVRHRRTKGVPAADIPRRGDLRQLFSEPGAGSDLASLTTKATKVDGGWRITGQKIGTTGAQLRMGRTAGADGSERSQTQWHHLSPARYEEPGIEKPLRELNGNAMFNTVFIDDVFVPTTWCSVTSTAAGRSAAIP